MSLRRALRPDEVAAGTDFTGVDATWRSHTTQLHSTYRSELDRQIAELVDRAAKVRTVRDIPRVVRIQPDPVTITVIADALTAISVASASAAAAEVSSSAEVPLVALGVAAGQRASAVANVLAGYANQAAQAYLLRAFHADRDIAEVQQNLDAHLRGLSWQWAYDQLSGAMTAAQNHGREVMLDDAPGHWLASEVLDGSTCPPCLSVDGTTYPTREEALADYPAGGYRDCRGGPRCRGMLVKVNE